MEKERYMKDNIANITTETLKHKFMAWIKHPQTWGFFVSVAVMAIVALAFFYPDNFEGNSLQQADIAQGMANGQEGKAFQEATGEKALWTNSLFSGMPTFQISPSYPSNNLFSWINTVYGLFLPQPSNLLFMMMLGFLILLYCMKVRWWISLIGAIAWAFSSYYIIIIGAGHLWKFITLAYIPPTIGGLVLCYRGRYLSGVAVTALFAMLQLNSNHPQMSYYFAFVMAGFAIVALIDLCKQKKAKQWVLGTCAVLAAGMLAVGANLPSLYHTYKYAKETKRAQSELVTTASEDSAEASAERPTGGMPYSQIVGWSYGKSEMLSLLIPNIRGGGSAKPVGGQMHALAMGDLDAAKTVPYPDGQLLPYFSQYFNDSEGTNGPVYVGAVVLALFLLGCIIVPGALKWMLVILTAFSILLSLGYNFTSLTDFMIYHFPLYNKFRAVESILVIAEFTIPLLGMLALAKMLAPAGECPYEFVSEAEGVGNKEEKPNYPFLTKSVIISFGICALICLVATFAPGAFGSVITTQDMSMISQIQQAYSDYPVSNLIATLENLRHGMIKADAMRSLLFIVLAGGLLLMYLKNKSRQYAIAVGVGIGLLILFDLTLADKRYVSHESFVRNASSAALPAELNADDIDNAILQDTDLSYRVMDIPGFPLAKRSYRHKMIGGYHAAKLNRYDDLINHRMAAVRSYGYLPELRIDTIAQLYAQEYPDLVGQLLGDYNVLDMLNARYIITGDKEQPLALNENALGNAWFVDKISYVDNANAEMNALATINPANEAVADRKFAETLGYEVPEREGSDAIKLTSYTPNTLTYNATTKNGGLAVFSEVYFPWGWKATIDGENCEIGRVNYVLRSLRVPAGTHEIVMTFSPDSLRATSSIAYACIILIYLLLAASILFVAVRKGK